MEKWTQEVAVTLHRTKTKTAVIVIGISAAHALAPFFHRITEDNNEDGRSVRNACLLLPNNFYKIGGKEHGNHGHY